MLGGADDSEGLDEATDGRDSPRQYASDSDYDAAVAEKQHSRKKTKKHRRDREVESDADEAEGDDGDIAAQEARALQLLGR
jgi:hypothetical protein